MSRVRIGLVTALAVLLAALSGVAATPVPQASPVADATPVAAPPLAYPPDADVHGASLGEWHGRYWQWVTSLPVEANPALDPTGASCGFGQHGPVAFVPRTMPPCTVPAGTAVFLPIAGTACTTLEAPFHNADARELAACAAADAERYTGIAVRVNGEAIPDIDRYRAASPMVTLHLPDDNLLAMPAGTGHAVADGYAVVLAPLPVGEHEIVIHVEVVDGYALPDKTLRLTVVEPTGGA